LPAQANFQLVNGAGQTGWKKVPWEQLQLPFLARKYRIDVLHCPDYSRPVYCPVPIVNTIHDLSFFCPERYSPYARRTYKGSLARISILNSRRLIAVSEFTKREVVKRFQIPEERITAIHLGVDPSAVPPPSTPDVPFILYVGTLEERKNISTLVRAFGLLKSSESVPHRLVLVGQQGWGWPKIRQSIENCPANSHIDLPGYVSREELMKLYSQASLFVYPSHYEGFGLPLLEAMAAELPVACSRQPALEETAGDAAEYFDPQSADDMARVIRSVIGSETLREDLRARGRRRAAQFTWEECARRHLEVYRMVVG
jgi:glycosyltransferase involved in cell wall biosynthesis